MDFFCPSCQTKQSIDSYEVEFTKYKQAVAVTHCPVCNQELAAYGVETAEQAQNNV